jgi:hypothetical protein
MMPKDNSSALYLDLTCHADEGSIYNLKHMQ